MKNCAKCGTLFDCKEDESCWCFKEPRLKEKEIRYNNCLCKDCHLLEYRQRLLGV